MKKQSRTNRLYVMVTDDDLKVLDALLLHTNVTRIRKVSLSAYVRELILREAVRQESNILRTAQTHPEWWRQ